MPLLSANVTCPAEFETSLLAESAQSSSFLRRRVESGRSEPRPPPAESEAFGTLPRPSEGMLGMEWSIATELEEESAMRGGGGIPCCWRKVSNLRRGVVASMGGSATAAASLPDMKVFLQETLPATTV